MQAKTSNKVFAPLFQKRQIASPVLILSLIIFPILSRGHAGEGAEDTAEEAEVIVAAGHGDFGDTAVGNGEELFGA